MYDKGLKSQSDKTYQKKGKFHVYHLYVVAHKNINRDVIFKKLKKFDIFRYFSYPYPLHKMLAYKNSSYKDLGVTENIQKIFSLPTYPTIENKN